MHHARSAALLRRLRAATFVAAILAAFTAAAGLRAVAEESPAYTVDVRDVTARVGEHAVMLVTLTPCNGCRILHAYHNRGISFDKKGAYRKAIGDFTKVLELDRYNANAYFNRGSAYDSLGDFDKAIADYTRALDLDMAATKSSTIAPTTTTSTPSSSTI